MNKLSLYLTYDYELPLGGVRDYEKGLFAPADKILDLADELKVPLVLFVDICSAIMFKQWEPNGYYKRFVQQVQSALLRGHDIQLHIHPHWLTSTYANGSFFPSNDNMLSYFHDRPHPMSIDGIVEQSVNELNQICRQVKPDYACVAYRAGSFNLAPKTELILAALQRQGIRIDSSIPKGFYLRTDILTVDHRFMPKRPNWFLRPDCKLNETPDTGIFEVPVAGKSKNFITNLPARFAKKKYQHRIYDHTGKGHIGGKQRFWDVVLLSFAPRLFGFDHYFQSDEELIDMLNHNLHLYRQYDNVHLSLISHPKAMGDYHLGLMRNFIQTVQRDYAQRVTFSTFAQLAQQLKP